MSRIKSMDELIVDIRIGPTLWAVSFKDNKNAKVIASFSGTNFRFTSYSIDPSEFGDGDVRELIDEVNKHFEARGVPYRLRGMPMIMEDILTR